MRLLFSMIVLFLLSLVVAAIPVSAQPLPEGFCYVREAAPGAMLDVRYYTDDNFVGAPVDGYEAPEVILTCPAAEALAGVQTSLARFGLALKVFDGYRPQRAVDHFVRWAADLDDTRTKADYYPDVEKEHLFRDGYIAAKSGHTRGSTVDVTIVDAATGAELDMGSPFDFFGKPSWPENPEMDAQVRANRALLRAVMAAAGFTHLQEEWWHFTLADEPYPDTYFEFPVR